MATHVRGDDMETVLEVSGARVKRLGTRRVAMDAQHRRGTRVAPVEVVQAQAMCCEDLTLWLEEHGHGIPLLMLAENMRPFALNAMSVFLPAPQASNATSVSE